MTPAAWGSFQTGMNPGRNGAFHFTYWDTKQKKKHYVSSKTLHATIWEIASQHNRRIAVINVPMTYPPKTINGYMVTGLLTPSLESEFTHPPSLKPELLKAVPDYQIFNTELIRGFVDKKFKSVVQHMIKTIDSRAKVAQFIMKKEPLDIFMVHFQAPDALQHIIWAQLQQGQPNFDRDICDYIFSNFYRRLDQHIEQIKKTFQEKADADCVIFIVSDHGFQLTDKRFNLGKWLHQQGYLCFDKKFFWFPFVKNIVGKIDVLNLRRHLANKLKSKTGNLLATEGPVSWQNSRAISIGSASEGCIYLLEADESKRSQTQSEITSKLEKIKDPEDGTSVVKRVYRKEELFKGNFIDFMPDLIIDPADNYTFTGFYKADPGLFHKVAAKGKHHQHGIVIAAGKHIKHLENIKAHITDIAPTILYYLGLPIDGDVDGRVLEEIFTEQFLNQQPAQKVSHEKKEVGPANAPEVYSENDQQKIEERLKDLGYI
jgi:predicted AlkP superfamily phosphohydrolase/phosphomutase